MIEEQRPDIFNQTLLAVRDRSDWLQKNYHAIQTNKLDAWLFRVEIMAAFNHDDFQFFDFCTRPADFDVYINDVLADVSYTPPLPSLDVSWGISQFVGSFAGSGGSIDVYQVTSISLFYPSNFDATYRPYLQVRTAVGAGLLGNPFPLPATLLKIRFEDKTKGNGHILHFNADIAPYPFNKANITMQKWSELAPQNFTGDFFNVVQVDSL